MRVVEAPFPSWGVDCISTLTPESCAGLRDLGCSFAMRYLTSLSPAELQAILSSGLLAGVVTYADAWGGEEAVAELKAIAWPAGADVYLDLESVQESASTVTQAVNAWAAVVVAAGYRARLYNGINHPLTAEQLYVLPQIDGYWCSASDVPTPACGYVMRQCTPSLALAGVNVDVDYAMPDWRGRRARLVGL